MMMMGQLSFNKNAGMMLISCCVYILLLTVVGCKGDSKPAIITEEPHQKTIMNEDAITIGESLDLSNRVMEEFFQDLNEFYIDIYYNCLPSMNEAYIDDANKLVKDRHYACVVYSRKQITTGDHLVNIVDLNLGKVIGRLPGVLNSQDTDKQDKSSTASLVDNCVEVASNRAREMSYDIDNMKMIVHIDHIPSTIATGRGGAYYESGYLAVLSEKLEPHKFIAIEFLSGVTIPQLEQSFCFFIDANSFKVLETFDSHAFDWIIPKISAYDANKIAFQECEKFAGWICGKYRPRIYMNSVSYLKYLPETKASSYRDAITEKIKGRKFWSVIFLDDIDDYSKGFICYGIDMSTGEILYSIDEQAGSSGDTILNYDDNHQ